MATSLADYLHRHPEIESRCTKHGQCDFFTTESEEKFRESAYIFLKDKIDVQNITLE